MSNANNLQEITCTACGQPCTVVTIDNGIGPYEYWGATGFDSQLYDVSNCCEADYNDPREAEIAAEQAERLARIAAMPHSNPPF